MVEVSADFEKGRMAWSIARLAREFGMARETVTRRLADAGVRSVGTRSGHLVYHLVDVAPFLVASMAAGSFDPANLKPTDRRAWFQSENERLKFEEQCGVLILAAEVREQLGAVAKIVVRSLETLPDRAERDLRCGAEVVEYLQGEVRSVRAEIAAQMESEADEVADG